VISGLSQPLPWGHPDGRSSSGVTAAISVFLALVNPKANKLCWLLHLGWNLPEHLGSESIPIKRKAIEWPISPVPEKSLP
jgi:hypothetical protein